MTMTGDEKPAFVKEGGVIIYDISGKKRSSG